MNDADKKAFEAAFENYDQGSLANYDHVDYGFKAACEWRDSQVGEPFGWVNSQGQFMTHQEKQDAPIEFVEREGFDTPVYATPPAALAAAKQPK